jgi:autotransporter-associated beta strand protein
MTPGALADDPPDLFLEHLADFVWTGAGNGVSWQDPANWTAPTFPMDYPYTIPTFPDDPNRIDDPDVTTNVTEIWPVVGANLSGNLTSDRTVNIAGSNVTVASVKLGGTGTAVTSDVTATSPFRLVFENTELNDTETNPGDENAEPEIEPEPIWSFNQGRSLIWSTGTAGVGKENRITAPIQLNDDVDVEGDRDLHIYGDIYEGVIDRDGYQTGFEEGLESSLNSLLSGGAKLYIHGNIHSVGMNAAGTETASDGPGGDRRIAFNRGRGIPVPPDPQNPPEDVARHGIVEIFGTIMGDGLVSFGAGLGDQFPLSTVIVHSDNVAFEGRMLIDRGNIVLGHDNALGGPDMSDPDAMIDDEHNIKTGNPTQQFGFNFISTDDDRNIPAPIDGAQWITVRGASGIPGIESYGDHSIEFSGLVTQSNTRGWINLLPAGKTLTLSGPVHPNKKSEDPPGLGRALTFDGTGKTILSGGVHDQSIDDQVMPGHEDKIGYLRIRGTGAIVIDGRVFNDLGVQIGFNATDYNGFTFVEGGNLHFRGGQSDAFEGDDLPAAPILSRGGAVGVDEGVRLNSDFLAKLNNSSSPNWDPATSPFFDVWGDLKAVLTTYSNGGLMLGTVGTNEYSLSLDFTTGDLARAANMSLAAHETGSTYTGTITPSSTVAVYPDTYQLGGGSGTLKLQIANQLTDGTGPRNLLVTNGGEVGLEAANNYTGVTRLQRKYAPSNTAQAQANRRGGAGDAEEVEEVNENDDVAAAGLVRTTLTVKHLANGGTPSSIGSSSSDAANLVIQGSTLKYGGDAAANSDRLFTVGASGATVDASGDGPVSFTNTGALAIDVPARRNALLAQSVPGSDKNTVFGQPSHPTATRQEFHTEDLTLGMRVYTSDGQFTPPTGGSPVRITNIENREVMQAGQPDQIESEEDNDMSTEPNAWGGYPLAAGIRVIQFGPAPQRFLTLSGENSGNNTLGPLVGNAPAADIDAAATTPEVAAAEAEAGYGTVGIRKNGVGKWVLTNANTYTGPTDVQQGTLLINGDQSSATGLSTVSAGATLGGFGTLGGALTSSGTVAPGDGVGTLTVMGNYSQSSTATLAIEIGGTAPGAFDVLTVVEGTDTGPIAGDYNEDNVVNAADYTVWRDHLGQTFQLPNEGDDVSPGMVDRDDYDFWKENFGDANLSLGNATLAGTIDIDLLSFTPANGNMFTILTAERVSVGDLSLAGESSGFELIVNPTSLVLHYTGAGSGSLGIAVGSVPEPASGSLLAVAILGIAASRRRRR